MGRDEINKPALQLRVTTEPPAGGTTQEASFSMTMEKFQIFENFILGVVTFGVATL